MGLKGRSDFIGGLQRVIDGPVPCIVVNHELSIPAAGALSRGVERGEPRS
jgi:hypothetical protein